MKAREAVARLRELAPGLTPEEQSQATRLVVDLLDAEYKDDGWAWLLEQVKTKDEATSQIAGWPDRPYLRDLWQALNECPRLAIPKSRRVMASWTVAAWFTYRARYWPIEACIVQSRTEDEAAFVVRDRCQFIEDNLAYEPMRRPYTASYGLLQYPHDSHIRAVAQGGNMVRGRTITRLFMDESEFQPEARDAFVAALPLVEKKAQIVIASTAHEPDGLLATMCKEIGFYRFGT
jgi:hypothetical protein